MICATAAGCAETGTGGSPSPYQTQPNVFLGEQSGTGTIIWNNVPIDPPGPNVNRTIRITNLRADASQLPLSTTFIPTQITATVSDLSLNIVNPTTQTEAFIQRGVVASGTNASIPQCGSHNASLIGGTGTPTFDFNLTASEGFASSFKRRDIGKTIDGPTAPQPFAQNVPGFPYNTESGFYAPALFSVGSRAGLADFGTRIQVTFNNVGAGVRLFVPTSFPLTANGSTSSPPQPPAPVPAGIANAQIQLVQADQYGNSASPGYTSVPAIATVQGSPVAEVNYSGNTAYAVYEIVNSDPNVSEVATIPVAVAFNGSGSPPALGQMTVNISEAPTGGPLAGTETANTTSPIPRFVDTASPFTALSFIACSVPAAPVSVNPNTGSGPSQLFSFNFTDGNGAADIVSTQIDISGQLVASGACYVYYARGTNALYLANDAGAWQGPLTVGAAGTLQNSQCTLDAGGSSVSSSGSVLTLNLALSFELTYSGAKNIFMEVQTATKDSGWSNLGTWTVSSSGPPEPVSVTPSSGSGSSQVFSFRFTDPKGYADMDSVQVFINTQLDALGGCQLQYLRGQDGNFGIYLYNDQGSIVGPYVLGSSSTVENSQCSLSLAGSSASGSGVNLTLNLALSFAPSFAGQKLIFMEAQNGLFAQFVQMGTWTVTGSTPLPDFSVSMNPSSRSVSVGGSTTYTVSVTPLNGFSGVVSFLVDIPAGITTSFNPATITGSGSTTMTVSALSDANPGSFTVGAVGISGGLSHTANASLNITSGSTPSGPVPTGVQPNSGSGPPITGQFQIFTFTFSDPNGATDIVSTQVDLSPQLSSTSSCYIYYSRAANTIYLADDAGFWSNASTLGSTMTISNSQCTLNVAQSSASTSGTALTLNVAIAFQFTIAPGRQNIFAEVQNATQDSGWSTLGTWTVTFSPDFSLTMSPNSQTVSAGGNTTYTVTVNPLRGFSGVVSFGTSGLPSGTSATFNPATVTGSGSTTVTINTTSGAATGNFAVTVSGTSGVLLHDASAGLNIIGGNANAPPTPNSVSPNSGSGSSQTFAFAFTDPNGATDIVSAQMDVNAQLSSTSACYFYYSRASNALYLSKDAGGWQGPLTVGSAGTLSNSQCSVDAGASSASASGNTLTLSLAISFQAAFAGAKGIFMEVQNATQDSGWSQLGSWTATAGSAPSPDFSLGMNPSSNSIAPGASANYAVTVTPLNGFSGVVSFNASGLPSGATASFNPTTVTGSGATTLTVNTSSSGGTGSFTIGVTGTSGALSHNTSASLGIISGSANTPPEPVSVTPNSSSGSSQTFAFNFSDPNGATDIVSAQMDINAQLSATNACYFYYSRALNALYLANNAGAWQGPVTVGSAGMLSNSECSVNAGSSSVSASGTTLTLNLAISFQAAFAGAKGIFMEVQNATQDSGWSNLGSWTVTSGGGGGSNGPPAPVSVTPNSSSGSSQTFAFTFTDPNGATDIVSTQMDINAQLSSTNACYFYYSRASNALYLANDAGAWQGPVTVGGSGTLSNSQCSVNAGTSSMSVSGNTLTLNLAVSFEAGFAGAKNIYMEVQNATVDSGWSLHGAWTVP
jgi:hypothetical protein